MQLARYLSSHELAAYHIKSVFQDAFTFLVFRLYPSHKLTLSTSLDAGQAVNDTIAEHLNLLDLTMSSPIRDSAVDDFPVGLLRALGYAKRNRVVRTRKDSLEEK